MEMATAQIDRALCDRFIQVVKHYGKTYEPFCAEFDFHRATISDIKKHKREPSREIMDRIVAKGDISEAWLRRGQGAMLSQDLSKDQSEQVSSSIVDGSALLEASQLVDELVIRGRDHDPKDRWEWISLVAEEIVELRALGRPMEIRKKVKRWIEAARSLKDEPSNQ